MPINREKTIMKDFCLSSMQLLASKSFFELTQSRDYIFTVILVPH